LQAVADGVVDIDALARDLPSAVAEVLFEGCLRAERGKRYPVCVEGARACPPEDVGGTWGYQEFLEAITDPGHERHEEFRDWIGGRFDPEAFDPAAATREMRRGLPYWRSERWV
jgi:hypothetical protein